MKHRRPLTLHRALSSRETVSALFSRLEAERCAADCKPGSWHPSLDGRYWVCHMSLLRGQPGSGEPLGVTFESETPAMAPVSFAYRELWMEPREGATTGALSLGPILVNAKVAELPFDNGSVTP